MAQDNRARLKEWLSSGEARLEPLTFPQRELWETAPAPPGDVSNNICATIQLRGALTPQGSEAAVQRVVDRQEALRLSILPGKGQPVQMIRKTAKPALKFRELSAAQRTPEALEELAEEVYAQPFDLVQGPLYRAEVFRRSADDHVLVFAIHHAIADGWTLGVFVQDLFAAYLQVVRGMQQPLPSVPQSYSEWGAAERAFWQPAELARRGAFWKENLVDAPRLWSPPADPAATGTALHSFMARVPAELARAVRDRARRDGATLFSALLSGFQITLSKWTGADDITVGTPVANRTRQAVRETMGYCSGVVPLRGQIDRSRTFSESLRAVHQATVDCFANAMPFAELVRAVGEPIAPGRNPVFEVRFALQNHPIPDVSVPTFSLKLRMRSTGTARFDLACEITEMGEELEVEWLFKKHLFATDDVENLSRTFLAVLAGACRSPEISTADLMTALR